MISAISLAALVRPERPQIKSFQKARILYCLTPAETMHKITDFISLLFNVASSQDVPFHQLQYIQYTNDQLLFSLLLTMQGVDLPR